MCLGEGRVVAARIADHVEPHHNDPSKFWTGALQSLCAHCHESRNKFVEHRGFDNAIGADGMPIDPGTPSTGIPRACSCTKGLSCRGSFRIVEALDVVEYISSRLISGPVRFAPCALGLQRREE